ncbi:MAG TPA: efflux RND transporter periplasmic adaptor subunit [Candidatus Acidoferrales bacterium]|nr:efflux RND transporter periplasmic adaptor subunit [Candidatus Acidoferrales bacterium]
MKLTKSLPIAFFAFLFAISGCSSDHTVIANTPETVGGLRLFRVQQQTVPDSFEAVGTVRAARAAQISAEVMGRVTAIHVREGDTVRQGETLAVLEDMQPRAGVQQAKAALMAADHEVAAAESERVLAQATFARLKKLYDEKSISPHEFDEINARVQSATARHDAAVSVRSQAAAGLQQASIILDRARIRAPFDGMVTERQVDPGALASPGMPLLTVEATGRYRLETSLDERDLKFAQMGAIVPVRLDSLEGKPLTGKVVQIVPAADPATRSFIVKVELPANANLRSGLYGHAEFSRGQKRAILIPRTAVLEHGQLQSVYAVRDNNLADLRYVTLGRERTEGIEVLSGLSAGDRIVSDPGGRELAGKRIGAEK